MKQARADADTLIVSTALAVADAAEQAVVIVGTDTDLLVMLVARAASTLHMYMLCRRNPVTLYDIQELKHAIGDTSTHMLFVHAISGCDTVSAMYRQGKRKAFNIVHTKPDHVLLDTFTNTESTHEAVERAGEQFVLNVYGAQKFKSLNKYRYVAYKRAVGRASLSSSFSLPVCLQLVRRQSSIHIEHIWQFRNGWETHYLQQSAVGECMMMPSHLWKLIFPLLPPNY